MNYLKALGVLKIIVEQNFDPTARGSWKDGIFCLHTKLTVEELCHSFTNRYRPTPIFSPWNGEAGFLADSGSGYDAITKLKASTSDAFLPLREAISEIQSIELLADLSQQRSVEKPLKKKKKSGKLSTTESDALKAATAQIKALKEQAIYQLRANLPEQSLAWLDACLVVGQDGFKPAPYLGSGGVDGRMEFSVNFINNLMLIMEDSKSLSWLRSSLLGTNEERNIATSIGQFAPGRIGGANGTQGMEGSSMINPWDFVLMMEGAMFLAGSTTRRLGSTGGSKSSFPFTMNSAPLGVETLNESDGSQSKGELWLPLWERPASIGELKQLFAEGRADLNGKQARDGLDFSRAIANLGVDRGIKAFSRHAFLQRNGLSFIATPLGHFNVAEKSNASLLREIDPWLAAMKRSCNDKTPARFRNALREIEQSIFDYCQHGDANGDTSRFQRILINLGKSERIIAGSPKFRADAKGLRPISLLSSAWVNAAADSTHEWEIALAIASLYHSEIGPIRLNLEDITIRGTSITWADRNHAAVWSSADLPANLAAVLYRRVMMADKAGNASHALTSSHRASLASISAFLSGDLDFPRITDLLWALSLCKTQEYRSPSPQQPTEEYPILPAAFCLLKHLFHPHKEDADQTNPPRPDLGILGLLRADRTAEACQRAVRILRGKNLTAKPFAMRGFPSRDSEWLDLAADSPPAHLAAALLIPISHKNIHFLNKRILRTNESHESTNL
jgi:CRISPR-associated protein Csx17